MSDFLTEDDTAPWTDTTTIVRRADAHQAVEKLKELPGENILMFGSRTPWNDLLVAGLVDELHLMVGAAVLGGGAPVFSCGPVPRMRLLDSRPRRGSDNVLLCYEVINHHA
ncbi:dihydrofolate reductase family protein [Microtetraspora malaysiensis]|uniref:dihydrofolate reductase family protein n=1 Tax=Microtetraspora malaysiensis TaxID=161358 RepID=UPI00082ECDFD|nr:dihydrofolate reductase family protein [Microtetraspora malaysiensis]